MSRYGYKEHAMFFELRQYRTKPGQREKWVKFMECLDPPL